MGAQSLNMFRTGLLALVFLTAAVCAQKWETSREKRTLELKGKEFECSYKIQHRVRKKKLQVNKKGSSVSCTPDSKKIKGMVNTTFVFKKEQATIQHWIKKGKDAITKVVIEDYVPPTSTLAPSTTISSSILPNITMPPILPNITMPPVFPNFTMPPTSPPSGGNMNCNCQLPMLGGMSAATGRSLGHFSLDHIPQQISTPTKRLHLNRNLNDDNLIEIMGGLLGNTQGSNTGEGGNLVEIIAGAVLGNTEAGNSEEGGNNGNGGLVEIINNVLGNLEGGNAGLGEMISSIVSNNTGETGLNFQEIIEAVISWFQDVVNNIDFESIFGDGFALPTDVEVMQILTEYLNNIDTQTLVEMMGGMAPLEMQLQCQCTPA